jgi:hypothetical protein
MGIGRSNSTKLTSVLHVSRRLRLFPRNFAILKKEIVKWNTSTGRRSSKNAQEEEECLSTPLLLPKFHNQASETIFSHNHVAWKSDLSKTSQSKSWKGRPYLESAF